LHEHPDRESPWRCTAASSRFTSNLSSSKKKKKKKKERKKETKWRLVTHSFRKQLLRQTTGGLAQIEEMRRMRDEEVRLSIAQDFLLGRASLSKTSLTQDSATAQRSDSDASLRGTRSPSVEELMLLEEDDEDLLEDGERLLEGEGMLDLADDEIEALEREVAS
jgi:hypothetical protein